MRRDFKLFFSSVRSGEAAAALGGDYYPEPSDHQADELSVMIGGAPFLMAALERELVDTWGMRPVYAFSVRESVDSVQPDGTVRKTAIFRHGGFIHWETKR